MRSVSRGLFCLLSLATGCDRGAPVDSALAKAKELEQKGLCTEGAQFLRSSASGVRKSDQGRLQLEVARLYHRANVHESALSAAEEAIRLGVADPDAAYVEADSLRALVKPGAEEKLSALLAKTPDHLEARLALARVRLRSNLPQSALPLFDEYFKGAKPGDPSFKVALLEHARALRNVGRYQDSADRYALLLEGDPLEGAYYSGLSECLYRMKLRKEGRFVEEIYKVISQSAFEEHVEDRLRETGNTAFALGQRAINRTRQHRYLEAFQSYHDALAVDQGDARIRTFYSDLAIQFRRLHEAREALGEGLKKGSQPASGLWWMLGRVALEEEDSAGAVSAFQGSLKALQAEGPQGGGVELGQAPAFSVHLALARAAIESGANAVARQAASRARELLPASWEPAYWLARVELLEGKPSEALKLLAEAAEKGGRDFADLAVCSQAASAQLGKREEAIAKLEALIQAQPGLRPAYEELRRIAKAGGSLAAGTEQLCAQFDAVRSEIRDLDARLQTQPLSSCGEIYALLGRRYLSLKDPRAFDYFFLAADLLPRNAEMARLLVSGLKQSQDIFVRMRYLRRLVDLEPGDESALSQLSGLYLKLHVRIDEAERLAERLHALKPTAESHRLRAEAVLLRGDASRARELLTRAIADFPGDSALRDLLGRTGG